MTLVALIPFPGMPHPDIEIAVDVAQEMGSLGLRYRITGDIDALALPPTEPPARGEALWEHSCFEAFLRPDGGDAYFELNFAPSRRWAAYAFDSYRAGMRDAGFAVPRIAAPVRDKDYVFVLAAYPPMDRGSQLGLSAVIEETDGTRSYWALAHPPGKPDFHHPDCFVLALPPLA